MKQVSHDVADEIIDHGIAVAQAAWAKLLGHDATAAIVVMGMLFKAVETTLAEAGELPSRQYLIDEVLEHADCCTVEPGDAVQ